MQSNHQWLKIVQKSNTTLLYISINQRNTQFNLYEMIRHSFAHVFGLNHNMSSEIMHPNLKSIREELARKHIFKQPVKGKIIIFLIRST